MMKIVSFGRSLLVALALSLVLSGTGRAEASDAEGVGYGVGSALLSVLYGPAKIVYAGVGSIVGGLAWALTGGDTTVSTPIFESALYGDYVVTPDVLKGERPLEFVGRAPESRDGSQVASPPSDGF